MGYVFFGVTIGLLSSIGCAIFGNISWGEAALVYWITGTLAPLLHIALMLSTPRAAPAPR